MKPDKNNIKNKALVVSTKVLPKHTEIILVRNNPETNKDTKLSEAFTFLPSGLVYKDETGMGATTLELISGRNSIIVEPIKITASSKALKHEALYVGSNTKFHKNKSVSTKEIQAYVLKKLPKFKKIIVVADSLLKVIDAIGEEVYNKYFLLIDEVDSLQLDSTYRKRMEECFTVYKKFPISSRAMLSATRIDFSDPTLQEPITFLKYDTLRPRNIGICSTTTNNKLIDLAAGMIFDRLRSNPSDKIFVAYNSVNGCYNVAQALVKKGYIKVDEIGIYCSTASKNKVGNYFKELDSDQLGFKLNFFTSAYFTGFDINEPYHLISISGTGNEIHSLSDRRLKQIAGRCRTQLLSETILHDSGIKDSKIYTKEELIDMASSQIEAFNCIKKHFSKHTALLIIYDQFIDRMSTALEDLGMKFTKRERSGLLSISYLNIDAYLETKRVQRELYKKSDALKKALIASGNKVVTITNIVSITVDIEDVTQIDRNTQVETMMNRIREALQKGEAIDFSNDNGLTKLQKEIVNDFRKLSPNLEKFNLLEKMESTLRDRKDSRIYNRLIFSAQFCCSADSSLFKQRFTYHFPLRSVHTSKEIMNKLNQYFVECNLPTKVDSEIKAVRLLNNLCSCTKNNNNKNNSTEGKHTIKDYNPYKLEVLKTSMSAEEIGDLFESMLLE
ncbi:MAG: hypothetical protein IPI46_07955 [Bacteroidetes bacterium]|nr:hypothetical protein [Bacteroidota bacterium]